VKRLKQRHKEFLKTTPNQIEHYVDNSLFISHGTDFKFLLTLFENREAKIYNLKDFSVIQELELRPGPKHG
jgi:hypothetical protein